MKKERNIKFGESMELLFELVNISNVREFVELRYNVEGSHGPNIDLYKILKKSLGIAYEERRPTNQSNEPIVHSK